MVQGSVMTHKTKKKIHNCTQPASTSCRGQSAPPTPHIVRILQQRIIINSGSSGSSSLPERTSVHGAGGILHTVEPLCRPERSLVEGLHLAAPCDVADFQFSGFLFSKKKLFQYRNTLLIIFI
ncbi:hypothetical protein ILYODFUR_032581 [Ilyodon furcidens]|uniref:Uncharacterized protein n=1 Tax=Ilyodon furcidens TaxID=33524 RepID=A0ABV0VJQ2_9TELE